MGQNLRSYLHILPTFISLWIFTHLPILKTFYISLFKWNLVTPKREFVGLANYLVFQWRGVAAALLAIFVVVLAAEVVVTTIRKRIL